MRKSKVHEKIKRRTSGGKSSDYWVKNCKQPLYFHLFVYLFIVV